MGVGVCVGMCMCVCVGVGVGVGVCVGMCMRGRLPSDGAAVLDLVPDGLKGVAPTARACIASS